MFLSKLQNNLMHSKLLPWFLAALSVTLLRLSFPRPGLWALAWVGFVPFFYALRRQTIGRVFQIGFVSGLAYFIAILFWLIHVTTPGMVFLAAYLALYFVVFALGWRYANDFLSFGERLVFVPSVWVVCEFVRAHLFTGFPWALLGYTQTPNIAALQGADLFGTWGLSFFIVFVNVFIFEVVSAALARKPLGRARWVTPPVVIALWFIYGFARMLEPVREDCLLKVAVVQSNIPQEIKWIERFREGIFRKHELLSELAVLRDEPDIVIWPETSFTDYLEIGLNDRAISGLAQDLKTPLLVGSIRIDQEKYYNSALLYGKDGELSCVYDKLHLVPFGEYIPARRYLRFVERVVSIEDFTAGEGVRLFKLSGGTCREGIRFGVLICFEDIFPELGRAFVREGADVLVNMTNDGWFGDTSSPYQHMQASVLRAVENRVYVVRAANTGVSCIIDDRGRLTAAVRGSSGKMSYVKGTAAGFVGPTRRTSLYARIGDSLIPIVSLYIFGMIVGRRRRH